MDTRIAERRRRVRWQRRHRRLRRTFLVAGLLLAAGAVVAAERSSLLALTEVRVVGTQRLEPAAVREAAALVPGTSALRAPLGAAERRVEALPLVADARVRRAGPLGVVIDVRERVPAATVATRGDRVVVDAAGMVMYRGGGPPGLPLIVLLDGPGPGGGLPPPGARVGAVPALAEALEVVTGLPGPLATSVGRYEVRGRGEVTLVLGSGTRVRFGGAEQVAAKARALGAVLEQVQGTPPMVDVRVPTAPVVPAVTGREPADRA